MKAPEKTGLEIGYVRRISFITKGLNRMEEPQLTQRQLLTLMTALRDTLTCFHQQCYANVAFLNEWCLYKHIRAFAVPKPVFGRRRATVGAILDLLEPYIPYKLSEDNFELFMALVEQQEDPQLFAHKAKLDFINVIREPGNWEHTLAVCETIRALKAVCSHS